MALQNAVESDYHEGDTEERTSFSEYSNIEIDDSRLVNSDDPVIAGDIIANNIDDDDERSSQLTGSNGNEEYGNDTMIAHLGENETAITQATQAPMTQPGSLPSASQIRQLMSGRTAAVYPQESSTPIKNWVPPTPRNPGPQYAQQVKLGIVSDQFPPKNIEKPLENDEDLEEEAISSENDTDDPTPKQSDKKKLTMGMRWREIGETPQSQYDKIGPQKHYLSPTRQGSEDLSQISEEPLDGLNNDVKRQNDTNEYGGSHDPRTPWTGSGFHLGKRRNVLTPLPAQPSLKKPMTKTTLDTTENAPTANITIWAREGTTNRMKPLLLSGNDFQNAARNDDREAVGRFADHEEPVKITFHSHWRLQLQPDDVVMLDINGQRGKPYKIVSLLQTGSSQYATVDGSDTVQLIRSSGSKKKITKSIGEIYMNSLLFVNWLKKYDETALKKTETENTSTDVNHGYRKARPSGPYESDDEDIDDMNSPSQVEALRPITGRLADDGGAGLNDAYPPMEIVGQPFKHCAFSVSMSHHPDQARIIALIKSGGGEILENGLVDKVVISDHQIRSIKFAATRTFAGVIAATQLRTIKYLEMVACGWPCLNYQFIYEAARSGSIDNWQEFMMAAGSDNEGTSWPVDIIGFAQRWCDGQNLSVQFSCRRLFLASIRPLQYVITRGSANAMTLLVALMSHSPRVVTSSAKVSKGSIVIDLTDQTKFCGTPRQLLGAIQRDAALPHTVTLGRNWLIESIISGRLV